jgi:predicted metal-dependent hydrolase
LALRRWAGRHAAQTLIPWLHELSRELALPFAEARIRGQRARWGSCSAQRVIHLNYKLLFLPRAAARYVLVHELCHTREMNHSQRFKDLVHRHAPDWRAAHAVIREAWKYVPAWVDGGYLAGSDF